LTVLDNEPFIFSAMGIKQNCKNTIFDGEPEVITGDTNEALAHFKTTDFKEFGDIIEAYAQRVREPTPDAEPNGRFFY